MVHGDHIHQDQGALWGVGQEREGIQVGHHAKLAHRPHAVDWLQLVHVAHDLHRRGNADARGQAAFEAGDVGGLATDDAAVVAVGEHNQLDPGIAGLLDDFVGFHDDLCTELWQGIIAK